MLDVGASCFETFAAAGPTYHCKLNGKSLQLAFKSLKNVERVGLVFDHDEAKCIVTMTMKSSAQKSFTVCFIEGDIMSVGYSKDQCTHSLRARPNGLADVVQNVHNEELKVEFHAEDVTVRRRPPPDVPGLRLTRPPRAPPQIQGFVEVADQKQMTSTITYSALDFDAYNFSTTADGQTDLIFAMKVRPPPVRRTPAWSVTRLCCSGVPRVRRAVRRPRHPLQHVLQRGGPADALRGGDRPGRGAAGRDGRRHRPPRRAHRVAGAPHRARGPQLCAKPA